MLVVEPGVLGVDLIRDAVVFAHEQRLHGGQVDILVGTDVAGEEQHVVGHRAFIGVRQTRAVERQQVAGTRLEPAAAVSAEGIGANRVRTVDHGAVHKSADIVDLLAGVTRPRAGEGVVLRPVEVDDLAACAARVEIRVALGHGDTGRVQLAARAVGSQIDVVVDELAPGVNPVRHQPAVGNVAVGRVGDDDVAN